MFPTKPQGQNDRMARAVISCFCQNLQFRLYFASKTLIFKLRPLLRFLYLINSFYRRYVCCIHNRSNRSNGSNGSNRSNRSTRLMRFDRLNFSRLARWSATLIGHTHIYIYIYIYIYMYIQCVARIARHRAIFEQFCNGFSRLWEVRSMIFVVWEAPGGPFRPC